MRKHYKISQAKQKKMRAKNTNKPAKNTNKPAQDEINELKTQTKTITNNDQMLAHHYWPPKAKITHDDIMTTMAVIASPTRLSIPMYGTSAP